MLEVHPLALLYLQDKAWSNSPALIRIKKRYGLSNFVPPQDGDWGFDGEIKRTNSVHYGWIAWNIKFPKLSGLDELGPLSCLQTVLRLLFNSLHLFDSITTCSFAQLMVLKDFESPMSEGCNSGLARITATLGPRAIGWISRRPHYERIHPVIEAMENVYCEMGFELPEPMFDQFDAFCLKSREIVLQAPGVDNRLRERDLDWDSPFVGYDIHAPNSSAPQYQLCFFAGLAAWYDLMLEELYGEL